VDSSYLNTNTVHIILIIMIYFASIFVTYPKIKNKNKNKNYFFFFCTPRICMQQYPKGTSRDKGRKSDWLWILLACESCAVYCGHRRYNLQRREGGAMALTNLYIKKKKKMIISQLFLSFF
jgi:hypothetical protein